MITVIQGKKRKPYKSLSNVEKSEIYTKRYGIDCEALTITELAYMYDVSVSTIYAVISEVETLLKLHEITDKNSVNVGNLKKKSMSIDCILNYSENTEDYLDYMIMDSIADLDTKIFAYIDEDTNNKVLFNARDLLPAEYMLQILSSYNDVTIKGKTLKQILNSVLNIIDNTNNTNNIHA